MAFARAASSSFSRADNRSSSKSSSSESEGACFRVVDCELSAFVLEESYMSISSSSSSFCQSVVVVVVEVYRCDGDADAP